MDRTTRRDFLKKAGLLSAVSVVSPAALIPAAGHTRHAGGRLELEWEDFNGILKHTFTISGSSRSSTPIVLTRLSYDGYTGYGEAAMPPYLGETAASVNGFLQRVRKEVLPGFNDPFRIQEIMEETDRLAAGNTAAKASVDIALHDLTGKIMGQGYCLW